MRLRLNFNGWILAGTFWHGLSIPLAFSLIALSLPANAIEVPAYTGPVVDVAHVMTREEQQALSASLLQFQKEYGPQIGTLIIPSLQGEPIESYSIKVAETWKLGDAKRDDGVIFLIAIQDRQLRIEVGQGLEGVLPDVIAGRIIRNDVVPYFRKGKYAVGILSGLNEIANRLGGTLRNTPASLAHSTGYSGWQILFFSLILLLLIFFRMVGMMGGGRGRVFRTRTDWKRNNWDDWFGGGGSSGGGFGDSGGGGGGGYSGGGASGRW